MRWFDPAYQNLVVGNANATLDGSETTLISQDGSLREANVLDLGSPPINIKSPTYGAKGDGVTDDSAAITAALTAAAPGQEVYAPPGTYLCGDIQWPGNNIRLRGSGCGFAYGANGTQATIFKAKGGTTSVFNLVISGSTVDRTDNHIVDIKIDGNSIAANGIRCSNTNIIERCYVTGCTAAGILLDNWTNSSRVIRCGLAFNTGYGLKVQGVSTTTLSVKDCILNQNTLGGMRMESGFNVTVDTTVFESNPGGGLLIFRPNANTNLMGNFEFRGCWFEDNGSTSNVVISIDAQTRNEANAPYKVLFRNCQISVSTVTFRFVDLLCAKLARFEYCHFDNSTASTALNTNATSFQCSWIECCKSSGLSGTDGISAAQADSAISNGTRCYTSDREIKRAVGSFSNSWANFGSSYGNASYWFDYDGNVHLSGAIKSGTVGLTAFTLPAGYRSPVQIDFPADSNNAYGMVRVDTSGNVIPESGVNTIIELNTIYFPTG